MTAQFCWMFYVRCCVVTCVHFIIFPGAGGSRNAGSLPAESQQWLVNILPSHPTPYGHRPGNASSGHSCTNVRKVPVSLRLYWVFRPSGVQKFYQKYTEAYGIPVLASKNVHDDALTRACYVLRFLLADHSRIRQSFYKHFGRVAVIGLHENITDLPEYRILPSEMNTRARGLGPTESVQVASGASENLLCYREDRYFGEDILLHEMAHAVHLTAKHEVPGFHRLLVDTFRNTLASGRWNNTYSITSPEEYFAEGVQSYFQANSYSDPPDGVHGPVDTPLKLMEYDLDLYNLIDLLFPCGNTFMGPCQSNRKFPSWAAQHVTHRVARQSASAFIAAEAHHVLRTDCDLSLEYQLKLSALLADSPPQQSLTQLRSPVVRTCIDNNINCQSWSQTGECEANSNYMWSQCKLSCGTCQ